MIVNLGKGATRPYVTVGAGIVTHTGGLPNAELAGRYQFQITSLAPVTRRRSGVRPDRHDGRPRFEFHRGRRHHWRRHQAVRDTPLGDSSGRP